MRLRNIIEGISKTDFFDFYSLLMAYQDGSHDYDPQKKAEIKRRLEFEASIIFDDQMDQLFKIIAYRMYEDDLAEFYHSWEIDRDNIKSADRLTIAQRVKFLRELNQIRVANGTKQWFTSVDGKWASLLQKYIELSRTGKDLRSVVMAIDRIYGLCHHGGMLADYFDESRWLEDALHIRSIGSPQQIVSLASSDVRSLVGSSGTPTEVTQAQKLKLAIDKASHGVAKTSIRDGNLLITIPVTVYIQNIDNLSNGQKTTILMASVGDPKPMENDSQDYAVGIEVLSREQVPAIVRHLGPQFSMEMDGVKYDAKSLRIIDSEYSKTSNKPSRIAEIILRNAKYSAVYRIEDKIPSNAVRMVS